MLSLSIKDVPRELADRLRERAARNHRSLQGELMHILEAAVAPRPFRAGELLADMQKVGVRTANDSARIVRADRDGR